MLLHDNFFVRSLQPINATHQEALTIAYSPLFHSTITFILSIFGTCSNLLCLLALCSIITKNQHRKLIGNQIEHCTSAHILSHEKYKFLIALTGSDLLLCLTSVISCVDGKFYAQSLVAHFHLCSLHASVWKLTLHFSPLLTIFIVLRYHYILSRKFPSKYFNTTTFNQLFCSDLCTLIPFVIALAWSVDGLWLWGEKHMTSEVTPTRFDAEQNGTNATFGTSALNSNGDESSGRTEGVVLDIAYISKQKFICFLQTNSDLNLTTRLLHLVQADFILLCLLHFLGFCLEVSLHIRLSCCLIARSITSSFLREQQLSLYILYIFMCLTLTSLPFYFHRTMEVLLESYISFNQVMTVNSTNLAQIILLGVSIKPVLYCILLLPSKILFKSKRFTVIKVDRTDIAASSEYKKIRAEHSESGRYVFRLPLFYPKIHRKVRTRSRPVSPASTHRALIIDPDAEWANGGVLV